MTMKFRAHETFFIRKGWISKGMKAIHNDPNAFISKERNPMDTLGIGSNMVKSMRFWMQAVGITEEPSRGRRSQTFTPLGEKIYQHDRYIEEIGNYIFFSTVLPHRMNWLQPGIIFSMYLILQNLQKRILLVH